MTFEAWFTVSVIGLVIASLLTNRVSVDTAMVGGLAMLMLGDAVLGDILPVKQAIEGFAHPAVMMIGSLFVVAAGLQETGGMEAVAQRLLGRPRTVAGAQLRMMVPVSIMSGFMNNTPIVAMYLPIINDWAKKLRLSPSKLYMPLSFAAIMGGKFTLIGTASNIVVLALYMKFVDTQLAAEAQGDGWLTTLGIGEMSPQKQFWGVGVIGVPAAAVGIVLVVALSRWLLPERRPASRDTQDARQYQVEMVVADDAPVIGKSIEEAGLRHLEGLYLTKIERSDQTLHAVAPEERLLPGDRLWFAGILDSVVDLRKIRGLGPATDQVKKVRPPRAAASRTLVEAVVAHDSTLVGKSVRKLRFRTKYNAAIIAVHRRGEQIEAKVGDIVLQPGDTLLLDTHAGFVGAYRDSSDFYLVSLVEDSRPIRHERAGVALAILVLLIGMLTLTSIHPVVAAFAAAGLMVLTRCVTGSVARSAVNWQVLLVIGAALGMGAAMKHTHAADHIATSLLSLCEGFGPQAMLFVIFVLASLFAQLITNNGAAVLMFPIAMDTARDLGANPEAFVFTLMVAAGSTYLSPVSYQTNLMVYGAGGYKFQDYARLGLPLTIATAVICALVTPIFFPLVPAP